jgi:hypothetical protein
MAELQDDAGNPIEGGVAEIQFAVKGQGELAAVGNGNPHEMPVLISRSARRFTAVGVDGLALAEELEVNTMAELIRGLHRPPVHAYTD